VTKRIAWLLLLLLAGAASAREDTGQFESGAWYRIEAPDGWRAGDALVLYQHGLDFTPPEGPPGLGPLRELMLAEGYAVAATGFRRRGWALFDAVEDNLDLLGRFSQTFGAPGQLLVFGGSMGGLIALRLAEAEAMPPVAGAYALCPAAAGSRLWDAAIDLRLAFDVVCADTGAQDLPLGSEPLEWALDLDQIPVDLGDLSDKVRVLGTLLALNRCTGVNLPPTLRSGSMQRRLDALMRFARIDDEDFLVMQVAYAIYVLSALVRAPDALAGRNPFTTFGVDYGDEPAVQAGIARIVADADAAARLRESSDFHGAVGATKIVSLHTSRDELVVAANQEFVRRAPEAQVASVIVDEDEPTHCGFSEAEGVAGWESLRGWLLGQAKPDADSLQQSCGQLVASGQVDGPCRFDPAPRLMPFDSIVRPRDAAALIDPPLPPRRSPPGDLRQPRTRR